MSDDDNRPSGRSRRTVLRSGAIGGVSFLGLSSVARTTAQEGPTTITECQDIDEPGEYVLGDDLSADGTCLRILRSDVTLDGNGHTIDGAGAGTGLVIDGDGITVRDLTVQGSEMGVDVGHSSDVNLFSIAVQDTTRYGIRCYRSNDLLCEDSTFRRNDGPALFIQDNVGPFIIRNCDIVKNGSSPVSAGSSAVIGIEDCRIVDNGGSVGFSPMPDSRIEDTLISGSDGKGLGTTHGDAGIYDEPTLIRNCVIRDCDGPGIDQPYGFLDVRECTLSGNRVGYQVPGTVGPYETILRNNNIENNEEYGVRNMAREDRSVTVDATCNWWGHESGPVHEDNPNESPQGDRVSGDVAFVPWSVERIEDDEGLCEGGREGPTRITECGEIDEPGEYVLGNDLSAEGDCLDITASDVTLDGNGHTIDGDGTGTGLRVASSESTVRNLTIQGFETGVDLGTSTSLNFSSVTIQNNAEYGIESDIGADVLCEDSTIRQNGRGGVLIDDYVGSFIIRNCDVVQNGPYPVFAGTVPTFTIEDCRIVDNAGPVRFTPRPESKIEGTLITGSDGSGLRAKYGDGAIFDDPMTITDCVIEDCDGAGIEQLHGILDVRECTLSGNNVGYRAGESSPYEATLRYSNIEDNEEYGVLHTRMDESSATVDARCNWWGHESGPVHGDNPNENPQGQRVSDDVAFVPWSVERIEDGEGVCEGGLDSEPDGPPEGGTGYVAKKSYMKIMDLAPYEGFDCWGKTIYVTDPSDVDSAGFDGPGEITISSSEDGDADSEPLAGHVIRAERDAVPVTLPTWGSDQGDCESLLFVDSDQDLRTDVEYRIVTDDPGPVYENVDTGGFAGTINEIVQVDFEPTLVEESSDT